MFLSLIRYSLTFALNTRAEAVVFTNLSVCFFQRQGPHEDIANFVAFKVIVVSSKLFSVSCRVIVLYYLKFCPKCFWYGIIFYSEH